jgi:hypothetical protein
LKRKKSKEGGVMGRYLLGITMCMALCTASWAQHRRIAERKPAPDEPPTKEEVEKYFTVMHIRENMQAMMDTMTKQSYQMVHDEIVKSGAPLPANFEERMDKLMDSMMKDFPVDTLIEAIVPVFQSHFTKDDLIAITDFYSKPVGQKLLKEQPELTQESMRVSYSLMQQRMESMREQVQTEIGQARLDLHHPTSGAPAKPN